MFYSRKNVYQIVCTVLGPKVFGHFYITLRAMHDESIRREVIYCFACNIYL